MSSNMIRATRILAFARSTAISQNCRNLSTTACIMASITVDSNFISQITAAEKLITNQDNPVQNGPTARAQSHAGQTLTSQVIHDITEGERTITGSDQPIKNGPTSIAQSILARLSSSSSNTSSASGVLDSSTIHNITEKEKELTGQTRPVKGGPTARAQQHAGEKISSQALHDITEGEKKVTGGERVKGGPTATAQSELAKSRS
ncbi:hypothetical protein DM02DRAFT_612545 [Periconia macrospinosa]|uniref:SMP domain-containing protein n=1 Tax=Periconia macrospinosa TaxID=97972 RepID=A0A2V1DXZ1_9PLEO|nr:hypothetical protein DM02DRAFT_612545 [Periconia macrospinosa]